MTKNHKPIRIVTINTWKGDGAYTGRLAALASQLRLLQSIRQGVSPGR